MQERDCSSTSIKLALETDSTRLISLFIDTTVIHNITHHGNRPEVSRNSAGTKKASSRPSAVIPQDPE